MKLSDFTFKFIGHGHYLVLYTTPIRGLEYHKTITDMSLIDTTKGNEDVKQKDLKRLYNAIKR
jgi:hypothetical protein